MLKNTVSDGDIHVPFNQKIPGKLISPYIKQLSEDELKYSILLHRLEVPIRSVSGERYNVMIT